MKPRYDLSKIDRYCERRGISKYAFGTDFCARKVPLLNGKFVITIDDGCIGVTTSGMFDLYELATAQTLIREFEEEVRL